MSELVPNALHAELHIELRALIASSRQRLAGAVNAELTRLYWSVGERMRTEVLGDTRAEYGARLLDQLGQQLANEFGRGFESRNLRRMVKFAEAFLDAAIVSTLSAKLSWSHFVNLLPLKTEPGRQLYVIQAAATSSKAPASNSLCSPERTPVHAGSQPRYAHRQNRGVRRRPSPGSAPL